MLPVRLVLIEEPRTRREGFAPLPAQSGCDVGGAASSGPDGRSLIAEPTPDVVVLEVQLGALSGLELTAELVAANSGRRAVLYKGPAGKPFAALGLGAERRRPLSRREREVLSMLAGGLTGEQVAEQLVLSSETVKTHVRNAMGKLEASTRVHAVALSIATGQINAPAH